MPVRLLSLSREIWKPEYILTPDANYAFLGSQRVMVFMNCRSIPAHKHRLVIAMAQEKKEPRK